MFNQPYFMPNSPLQQQGLTALHSGNQPLLVTWPTQAGKTWFAEAAIAQALDKGLKAIYVTPADIDSIAAQRTRWTRLFPGRRIGLYADVYDPQRHLYPLPLRQTDIFIVAPTHVARLLLTLPPEVFSQLGYVIVDDLHLMHAGRVPALIDLTLTYLRHQAPAVGLLVLAEALAHLNTVVGWLGAHRLLPDAPLGTVIGMSFRDGTPKYIPASGLTDPQALTQAIATLTAYDMRINQPSIVHLLSQTLAAYEGYLPEIDGILALLTAMGWFDLLESDTSGRPITLLPTPRSHAIGRHAVDVSTAYRLERILHQYPALSWFDMLMVAGIHTPIDQLLLPDATLAYLSHRLVGLHSTLLTSPIDPTLDALCLSKENLLHAIRFALFNYDRLLGVGPQTCTERYGIFPPRQLEVIALTRRLVGAMGELTHPTRKAPPSPSSFPTAILSGLLNGLPMGAIPLFHLSLSVTEIRNLYKAGFVSLTCLSESKSDRLQPYLGRSTLASAVRSEALCLLAKQPETSYTAISYSAKFPLVTDSAPVLRLLNACVV